MDKLRDSGRGMARGAAIAALYFAADLGGTFLAVGWLFDPTWDATLLILAACASTLAAGALAGGLFGLLWPRRLRFAPRRATLLAVTAVAVVAVIATSFLLRRGRNVVAPPSRPPLTAAHPAPVLWIVVDTLRADATHGTDFDFALQPAIGRFAAESLHFADAEATAGWTIPSMASLLTGIHNTTTDASAGYLPDWAPTLAERLWAAGYETHAVIDNAVLEPRNGFADGFESFFQRCGFRFAFSLPGFRLLPTAAREYLRDHTVAADLGARGLTDEALRLLAEPRDRPLFLWVQYMDPHAPYYPHPELAPDPPDGEEMVYWRVRDRLRRGKGPLPSAAQMKLLRHRYDAEARYVDAEVGRLLSAWRERFGDRSLILLTSDHGEEFLEHGHLSHSLTVHREIIHVPLVLRLPAGSLPPERARRRISEPVTHLDLVPTTLDLLGVPLTAAESGPAIQGTSWLPWLRGEIAAPPPGLFAGHARHGRVSHRYREGAWVYLNTMYFDGRPSVQLLFDLATDPGEQHDRFAEIDTLAPGLVGRYQAVTQRYADARAGHAGGDATSDEGTLRALGYIQ